MDMMFIKDVLFHKRQKYFNKIENNKKIRFLSISALEKDKDIQISLKPSLIKKESKLKENQDY